MSQYLFSNLRVIDCATVIAAPAAAVMLADFGADVIKIEQPGDGDMLRMLSDISTTPYADGDWLDRWLQFNMIRNEEMLSLLLTAVDGVHLLADERFTTQELIFKNRESFGDALQAIVATKTSEEWLRVFDSYSLPVNRVAIVEETATDPQILENDMAIVPEAGEAELPLVVNHPVRITRNHRKPTS